MRTTFILAVLFSLFSWEALSVPADDGDTSIDIRTALRIAEMKLVQLGQNDFSIKQPGQSYHGDANKILFHRFDLDPQGYVVVSGDRDLPPVIAYSFTGDFGPEDREDNVLLDLLIDDMSNRIEKIPFLPPNTLVHRNSLWDSFKEGGPATQARNFQQWPPPGTTPTGGWLESNWTQSFPYNDFCPIDLNSGNKSVAGCPAVAMAMIMNYHETVNGVIFGDGDDYYHSYGGNNFWIDDAYLTYDFPSWPQLNVYLDDLTDHYDGHLPVTDIDKAALTYACGAAARQVYNPSGSGTFGVDQAYDAYLKFNCDSIKLLDESHPYLYDRLAQNMKDALPAHIAVVDPPPVTMGHNMVVDGYNTDDYFHINFGWGGSYNGWYLLPDDIPYGLTVIEGIIVDIMNNKGILWGDRDNVSASTGGTVNLQLVAGEKNKNRYYVILASVSGTEPGIPLPGGYATLPLNWDSVTDVVIGKINTPMFTNFLGTLDNGGRAAAQLNLPPLPNYAGKTVYFAYCSDNPFDLVSNPIGIYMR